MSIVETVKDIKPQQWALIAGAGIGLGLLLRMRSKSRGVTPVDKTDTPDTLASTQQYGDYAGTGMTGWAGGALVNPSAPSPGPTTPVTTNPVPIAPVYAPIAAFADRGALDAYRANAFNQQRSTVPAAADGGTGGGFYHANPTFLGARSAEPTTSTASAVSAYQNASRR